MALQEFANNKRQAFRLERKHEYFWRLKVDDALTTRSIVNLSSLGLSFRAPTSFKRKAGQTLSLSVRLNAETSFECKGRILWSKQESRNSRIVNLFGVQFVNLPTKFDALIAQELCKETLKIRWSQPKEDIVTPLLPLEGSQNWLPYYREVIMALLVAGFIVAARVYEHSHPQDSLEYKFNQSLAKKLNH